jgi:hypothetical protein
VQKKLYMRALINLRGVKFTGKALQLRRRAQRSFTSSYYLTTASGKRQRVCISAFISILGIGSKQLKLLNAFCWANPGGGVPEDGRGKHGNRPNKIPNEIVDRIDAHILAFPRETSHYSLSSAADRFLDPELSVRIMWKLYLDMYEPHTVPPPDEAGEDERRADAAPLSKLADATRQQRKPQVTYGTLTAITSNTPLT